MPQVVGLYDNILDAARVAVTFPIPRTIYVLSESGELLGMIPAERLATSIFDLLDNSPVTTESSAGPNNSTVNEASSITAESLMVPAPVTISDEQTVAEALRILYFSHLDQVPVLDEKGQIVGVIRALDIVREWVEDTLETQLGDETESFVHNVLTQQQVIPRDGVKPSPESLLAKIKESEQARLRIYIGAAAGVGKTYQMLEEAHELKRQGVDVVLGFIEPHGRIETETLIDGLEQVPRQRLEYRGATFEELDVDAVIARRPSVVIVDELAHTNVPGSKNEKRYQDVLDILNAGISVITAVNIQHIESLNDAVVRITGVRVRETVPDAFFKRANEVVDIDISIDTLIKFIRSRRSNKRSTISFAKVIFQLCVSWHCDRLLSIRRLKRMITVSAKDWNKLRSRKRSW